MAIHIRIRETHLNHHPTEGLTFNERKPAFSEGLKNFFINTSSQKKAKEIRMHVRTITNAQMCGSNLSVSAEIHTTPETKHPITESVKTGKGTLQDLDDQDIEVEILLTIMKTAKYGTYCLGGNLEGGKHTPRSCKNELSHGSKRNRTAWEDI